MNKHHLKTPLRKADILKLKAGDEVFISGTIFTARDEAHLKILELEKENKSVPFNLDSSAIYHCGPLMQKDGNKWKAVAVGPTTSARMIGLTPKLLETHNVRAIIGKGGMKDIAPVLKDRCVYLAYTGGCAALANDMIKDVIGVCWLDELGMAEAVWFLEVKNFGPLIVGVDAHGNDLYQEIIDKADKIRRKLIEKTL